MRLKLKPILYFSIGLSVGVGAFFMQSFRETGKDEGTVQVKEDGKLQYKWYQPEIPKTLSFAHERVPIERWEVRERLEREMIINYYMHGTTLYITKLTTRFFPMIEQKLKANGVPDDFKYLCVAESALQNQVSAVGASGFWQFMKDTGPRYGLEINNEVDERYHPAKATDAACAYLKEAYGKFYSWTAAAASYNCGMGGYTKQIEYQKKSNYYDLAFPEETNRYIFRILALKVILSNAKAHGYIINGQEAFKPIKTRTVTVDTSIKDLAQFALDNGSSYKMLKLLNPWLRAHTLTVKPGKVYEIEFPLDNQ
ncbi:MAG: lytic transglycosylase domain-containing protein [Flavipsychrobacter sp.]|nr:lytic transglycosylase domain-containing protein [Flavipsychrobacter sp.]